MAAGKGFTIIEILIVLIILSVLIAIAIPNYYNSIHNSRVRGVENNLRAIGAGEQKYSEDHSGAYYASAGGVVNDFSLINSNLSLTMASVNDGFNYTCAVTGACSANNPAVTSGLVNTVTVDANGNISCSPGTCP